MSSMYDIRRHNCVLYTLLCTINNTPIEKYAGTTIALPMYEKPLGGPLGHKPGGDIWASWKQSSFCGWHSVYWVTSRIYLTDSRATQATQTEVMMKHMLNITKSCHKGEYLGHTSTGIWRIVPCRTMGCYWQAWHTRDYLLIMYTSTLKAMSRRLYTLDRQAKQAKPSQSQ